MNINQLYKYIGAISEQIPLVHSYSNKSVYDYWNMDEVKYGSVCFSVQNVSAGSHTTTYTGILYYGDRLMEDRSNIESVYSDATLSLQTIINTLSNSDDVEITFPIQITYFEQEFADQLAGAYANLTITVEGVGQCGFDGTILPTPIYPGEEGFDAENYYTKSQVDALLDRYDAIVDEKLDEYAKETELASYVTKEELEEKGYIDHIPSNYVTESELNETLDRKGYLTHIPDGYVTESELDEKLQKDGYLKEIPANYVTEQELAEMGYLTEIPPYYVTESELEDKGFLTEIPANYVTESELESKGYLTEIPANYVTESELEDKGYLTEVPSQYVTESELESKKYLTEVPPNYVTNVQLMEKGYLTEIPSYYITEGELDARHYISEIPSYYVTETELNKQNYASKAYVAQEILRVNTGGSVDLSEYVTQEELEEAINGADFDLSDYYTKEAIDGMDLATRMYVYETIKTSDKLEHYYTKTETDRLYTTPSEVEQIINQTTSLDNYYTKREVDNKIDNVTVDLSGYYTKHEVDRTFCTKQELDDRLSQIDTSTYATKDEVNELLGQINLVLDSVLNDINEDALNEVLRGLLYNK